MTLDAIWLEGEDGPASFAGDARDIWTAADGAAPTTLREAHIDVVARQRVIERISGVPDRAEFAALAGARAGGHLRQAVDAAFHAERMAGAPLYLLLDDLAGATLVCNWAWSVWRPDWQVAATREARRAHMQRMEGVCIGFRPGSSALQLQGENDMRQNRTRVVPLARRDDPEGWHALVERAPMNFRRARRLDVWREEGLIRVDAAFQDSSSAPDGGDRVAIHEYRLRATADAGEGRLLAIDIKPGTLPYKECPAAMANVGELIDVPLANLRVVVLERLRRTAGCTHLNDMLRALAEVPALATDIP
ncbi:DUF2889 domain-containing protein [Sphingomonas sp. CGMCC 1.13654]|uniref:DUF2889 domain-containing protein n=1 Tax=Sphingomonas chungangi TaxID=2683589 RepID=A0A838L505_9SPHN|nr:DUF2889 domain-containing protein [Sphingomonas chungangi]MBA2933775.1 DUF2889 domain-containing protein [Sphingomonas chungangi]